MAAAGLALARLMAVLAFCVHCSWMVQTGGAVVLQLTVACVAFGTAWKKFVAQVWKSYAAIFDAVHTVPLQSAVAASAVLPVTVTELPAGATETLAGALGLFQKALLASMASARLRACIATSDSVCDVCVPERAVACIAATPSTPIEITTSATSTSNRL